MMEGADENPPNGSDAPLSLDTILDLLAHHHRRAMLHALMVKSENTIEEQEMIARLEGVEQKRTGEKPSSDHLAVSLHHTHLPKLSQAGVVTYDENEERYQYHPDEKIEKWLELIESEHEEEL